MKEWRDIHQDFYGLPFLRTEWESLGFDYDQTKIWIDIGLKIDEYKIAVFGKLLGYDLSRIKGKKIKKEYCELVKKEYHKAKKEWFITHEKNKVLVNLETEKNRSREKLKELKESLKRLKEQIKLSQSQDDSKVLKEKIEEEEIKIRVEKDNISELEEEASNLKDKDFNYEECKDWIDTRLKENSSDFFSWVKENDNRLRKEHREFLESLLKKVNEENENLNFSTDSQLSNEAIRSIKNFIYNRLTSEQKSLLEELIPNKELRERYKKHGLCRDCQQPNTGRDWCKTCNAKRFIKDFDKWTSDNRLVNELIRECQQQATNNECILEWIPYEKFINVKNLAEGGFGKVYKAEWVDGYIENWDSRYLVNKFINDWRRSGLVEVALKVLNNSQDVIVNFLKEITNHKLFNFSNIVNCYGISQDPITKNYIMVMQYINGSNLREYLQKNYERLNFKSKLDRLLYIIIGLKNIHKKELVHHDFHMGNILVDKYYSYITDLGISRSVSKNDESSKVYGVLPYVAPEVLQGQSYTQASDIYSFGIVTYELFVNSYPYPEMDDIDLILKICQGYRPNIDEVKIPQLLKDLIKKCWDKDFENRLTSEELEKIISGWQDEVINKKDTEFYQQYQETEQEYNKWSQNTSYKIHPRTVTSSRPINTKQNTQLLEKYRASKNLELDINEFNFDELNIQEETETNIINIEEDWTNLSSSFTSQLISQWTNNKYDYSQTKEWIDIGLQPTDANFCSWLRDIKQLSAEEVLNNGNLEQLNQEFSNWWQQQQQVQIEQPPK